VPFHLYVPASGVDSARRLCNDLQIQAAEMWAYHAIGEQIRFTLVSRTQPAGGERPRETAPVRPAAAPAVSRSKPVRPAASRPVRRAAASAASKPRAAAVKKKTVAASRAPKKAPARGSASSRPQKRK
jgi:hypothetical protein